jgi:hypothetical protein
LTEGRGAQHIHKEAHRGKRGRLPHGEPGWTGRTLQLREFAFARNSLVFFARALDEIFELAPVVRELLGHFVSAAGRIPTDGTPKAHDITDLEFV